MPEWLMTAQVMGTPMRRKIPLYSPLVKSITVLQKRFLTKGKKRVRPESDAEAARIAFGNIAVSKEYVELKSER